MTLISKADAQYESPSKNPARTCSNCRNFRKPNHCAKVTGDVARGAWCRLWSKLPNLKSDAGRSVNDGNQ